MSTTEFTPHLKTESSSSGSASSVPLGTLVVTTAEQQLNHSPYHIHIRSSTADSGNLPTPQSISDEQSIISTPSPVAFLPALAAINTSSGIRASCASVDSRSSISTIPNLESQDGSPTTAIPSNDLYSLAGLPVLEDSIPTEQLPDELIVHDPHDLPYPVRYVRVNPMAKDSRQFAFPVRDPKDVVPPRRVAQLHLANENRIWGGANAHSTVLRAPLTLPLKAGSETATRVRVVAKTPAPDCGSHRQLHQEARIYHSFPKTLYEQHQQQGYVERPVPIPAPTSETAIDNDEESALSSSPGLSFIEGGSSSGKRKLSWREQFKLRRPSLNLKGPKLATIKAALVKTPRKIPAPVRELTTTDVAPAVPKYFGYYLLLKPDGTIYFETHDRCDEDGTCEVAWPPAILLIEDCGSAIQPQLFTHAQRCECYRLLEAVHDAGFILRQPAMTTDKILVQPGPLAAPRTERSLATPSFRIVDFGRGFARSLSKPEGFEEIWQDWCDHECDSAFETLQLEATS